MPKISAISVTLVLHITLCSSIRVPVDWNENDVKLPYVNDNPNEQTRPNIPNQYFEYTAKKPQFAIDIAAAHNVKSPDKHYTSYPIRPYTGVNKPELGKHQLLDPDKESYRPYQQFVASHHGLTHVTPSTTAYDVYHPYKAEEPALQEIYKDPILDKIRNDLRDSKNRLQQYENDAGKSDVSKEEYLESPEQTDHRYVPQKNIPSRFEIHRPLRRPVYYRPPSRYSYRENILNKKLRHPWNQNYAKVTPMHYRSIKNHLQNLRQHHALKFDDVNNEYPQLPIKESYAEKPDGFDIYEKGKNNFIKLRNNIDESINNAVLENRPVTNEKVELKDNDDDQDSQELEDEDEFVPIKNYAQVRKTETTKHLPRAAAFQDAESYDEIKNAPRLREAVKSTKAQVVYSEEGYEDSAYDHAGEQKHASDIEGHGGYLKEHELSGGKYQTPSVSGKLEDVGGSAHGGKLIHAEKWKNDDLENSDDSEIEDYSEDEQETSEESDIHADNSNIERNISENSEDGLEPETENEGNSRNKREDLVSDRDKSNSDSDEKVNNTHKAHVVNKREYKIPKISFDVAPVHTQILHQIGTNKKENRTIDVIKQKYPYYFKSSNEISNDSPLRYAENLFLIPNKTLGGTEFYDSRKDIVCPTIEEDIDPIPEKLKKGGNPDENESDEDAKEEFSQLKNNQRLEGLGDKIDCLKSKYFGNNPLDSPFFNEDTIKSPEPVTKPNINLFDRDMTRLIVLKKQDKEKNNQIANPKNKNSPYTHIQRKKRATPFIYEPYKIIKESQVAESKKTTTTNNISPLIKQLQSSKFVDRVSANQNKDSITKRNTGARSYKDIGKVDREKQRKNVSQNSEEADFVDVSLDKRRGEPRYEVQYKNHKSRYTPIKNQKSVSLDEYRDHTEILKQPIFSSSNSDITNYPHTSDTQNSAASNAVSNVIRKSTIKPIMLSDEESSDENEEEYDDYESDLESQPEKDATSALPVTTTTSTRPIIKERIITTTEPYEEVMTIMPILRLRTRFRSSDDKRDRTVTNNNHENVKNIVVSTAIAPKLSEKKKKLSKSTLVTDVKSYGEEDDDMQKEDIDALIGVQHDTEDYLPEYEKEYNKKERKSHKVDSDNHEDDENDEDDDDDSGDSEEDEEKEEEEDDDNDDESADETREEDEPRPSTRHTTPEPTKRTLPKTTETTPSTTELNLNHQKPIILKKKIEVHRESPVRKTSPNTTHFKQDIKEVEIIKTMTPRRRQKPQKSLEALDLYKDENLAKDVNKLGGVEIFRPDLDLESGPRHGGNYRSIETKYRSKAPLKTDVETSRSPKRKLAELNESKDNSRPLNAKRGGILRNTKRFDEVENLNDTINASARHVGNIKNPPRRSRKLANKSEKNIELSETNAPALQLHGGNLKAERVTNGELNVRESNDRNSEIIQDPDEANKDKSQRKTKQDPDSAANLLNTYARAVPMLTTLPSFILDPSKRKYYYVDV